MSELLFNPHILPFSRRPDGASLDVDRSAAPAGRVYELANNENPFGPSPQVIDAIRDIAPTLSYYPSYSDIALRQAIAETIGRGITPEHIYTGCSGFEALELITRAFLRPGDEVILSTPTFSGAYSRIAEPLGANIVDVPLKPETFEYRVDAVLEAVTDKTRLVMLCNPNNPTGTIVPAGAMDALMQGLPEHVLVVADEVYHHFVDDAEYPDSLAYILDGKNIVIVHSFSKAYGLAGMRLGYGIARPEIANYLAGMQRGFHQNKVALAAGVAACRDQEHLRFVVESLRAEARWVCDQFKRRGIRHWKPAANFILFETGMQADDLAQELRVRGFLLRAQTGNGLPYAMRLSFGDREANAAFIGALDEIALRH